MFAVLILWMSLWVPGGNPILWRTRRVHFHSCDFVMAEGCYVFIKIINTEVLYNIIPVERGRIYWVQEIRHFEICASIIDM